MALMVMTRRCGGSLAKIKPIFDRSVVAFPLGV